MTADVQTSRLFIELRHLHKGGESGICWTILSFQRNLTEI